MKPYGRRPIGYSRPADSGEVRHYIIIGLLYSQSLLHRPIISILLLTQSLTFFNWFIVSSNIAIK